MSRWSGLVGRFSFWVGARRAVLLVAVTTIPAWSGCGASTQDLGGETNWLVACERDDECDGMPCHCGICTSECSAASECGGLPSATCVAGESEAAEVQCGRAIRVGICLPECSRDADCSGNQRCASGACAIPAPSTTPDDSMPAPGGNTTDDAEPRDPAPASDDGPSSTPSGDNPTGDCVAGGDGSRVGHSPGADSTYLPDCELNLEREYYRVFVQSDGTAYMIPRPDNHPDFIDVCLSLNESDPLYETARAYSLCQSEAFDSSQVEQINSMAPADALALAHYLHERLVFFVTADGVRPYPQAQDILDLCKMDEAFRNGPMQERCDFELDAEESGVRNEIGWVHTGVEAEALAPALNALYGITDDDLCNRLSSAAARDVTHIVYGTPHNCEVVEDCVQVGHSSACHDACGAAISTANQDLFDQAVERVSAEQCATREALDCTPSPPPPCVELELACVDGQCVER